MTTLTIVPIVEGQGDETSVRTLLERLVQHINPEWWPTVPRPIRVPRGKIVKDGELERYVDLAARIGGPGSRILVLIDADDDCPAQLGPDLLARSQAARPDFESTVVLAKAEYEAWFLAAAASIAGRRGLQADLQPPADPEGIRGAKGWLKDHRTDGLSYGETIDQPALTAIFDLEQARNGAPSFDKLWREIERWVEPA